MKLLVAKSALVAVLGATSLVSAADPSGANPLPAPRHLLNLSPSFASHPRDLTLLAQPLNHTIKARSGVLTFLAMPRSDWTQVKQVEPLNRASIESLRFDHRLEGASLGLNSPRPNVWKFKPRNGQNIKKSN